MMGVAVLRGEGTTCEMTIPPIFLPSALNRGSIPTTENVRNCPPKPARRILRIKAAAELNRLTWMMACGCAFISCATAPSTLSLLTGDKALAKMGGRLRSISA